MSESGNVARHEIPLRQIVYRWAVHRGRPLYASSALSETLLSTKMNAQHKRKSAVKQAKAGIKRPKVASKETVVSDDEETSESAAVAAAAAANPVAPPKKASTLAEGIAMLNASDAKRATGRVRSLWADAKEAPEVKLMGTSDPYVGLFVGGKNVLSVPMQGKQGEAYFDVPAFPVKFSLLCPISATVQNNRPDAQYPKANPAEVPATVQIDMEKLQEDPTYADSVAGVELLCAYCSDSVVQPSTVMVFPQDHIDQHREAALAGDEAAAGKFTEAAQIWANQRGAPFLPCKVAKPGEPRPGSFKMTTKFFGYADPKLKGSGPHLKSIELARKLGGDNVEDLIEVIEKPENHGRQLRLVELYDESNRLVPPEEYRRTVAELRGGAVTARIVVKVGAKVLSPKERSVHIAAYIQRLMIVKRGDIMDRPDPGGGIAAFMAK